MVARVSGLRAVIEAGLVAAALVVVLLAVVPTQNTELVWQALETLYPEAAARFASSREGSTDA